jgi:hypothetical protein
VANRQIKHDPAVTGVEETMPEFDWKKHYANHDEIDVDDIQSLFYGDVEFFSVKELGGVVMGRKRYSSGNDAPQYAAFRDGKLIAGPNVKRGHQNRIPILAVIWGKLSFGFEYPDRHLDDGRYQVWIL